MAACRVFAISARWGGNENNLKSCGGIDDKRARQHCGIDGAIITNPKFGKPAARGVLLTH